VPKLPPYKPPKPRTFDQEEDEEDTYNRQGKNNDEEEDEEELNLKRAQLKARREMLERNYENNDNNDESRQQQNRKPRSVPLAEEERVVDPYASDETSYLIPILVAIGAFIPLLFCLCKL
jgi:hypothetical protein